MLLAANWTIVGIVQAFGTIWKLLRLGISGQLRGWRETCFSNSYGEASAFRPKEWLFIVWKNEQEEGEIKGKPRLKEAKGLKGGEKEVEIDGVGAEKDEDKL